MIDINDYDEVRDCIYKDEHYSVRDNGAIMRHQIEGRKKRPNDMIWTFGNKDSKMYCNFCGNPVHRIVATAFISEAPTDQHVVDHIDTNRMNNRPENLRWLTKLENTLNNEITRKKVIMICGSIEAFLDNPQLLWTYESEDSNFKWMRSVTKEEADNCRTRLEEWAKKDNVALHSKRSPINDDIFKPVKGNEEQKSYSVPWDEIKKASFDRPIVKNGTDNRLQKNFSEGIKPNKEKEETFDINQAYKDSLTANAKQHLSWSTPTEFPLTPTETHNLQKYYDNLKKGEVVTTNCYVESKIAEFAWTKDNDIIVICKLGKESVNPWSILIIFMLVDGTYAHESYTYFDFDGANKYFTIAQGKEWKGGDVFDDYC